MRERGLPRPLVVMLATLPLVQVGTVRAPVRLILPDLIALGMAAVLLVRWRSTVALLAGDGRAAAAAAVAAIYCVTTAAASVLSLLWITPANFAQLSTYVEMVRWIGTPVERTAIENLRLVQCVSALIVTLTYADTEPRVRAAAGCYVAGATAAAVYGLYTWAVMVTGSALPLAPETFGYLHLKRTAATFPEPAAYGGFALCGIALTLWLIERQARKAWLFAALSVQLFGAVTSLSTLLLGGLGVMWLVSVAGVRLRSLAAFTAAAAAAVIVVLLVMPPALVRWAIEKPMTTHASWVDRVTAWRAAASMALAYPALGVGTGLYAFNQGPFHRWDVSVRFTGGRVNSPALEVAAEAGVLGVLAGMVVFAAAWAGAARGGHGVAGLRAVAVLATLAAGYYSSRYVFLWVFTGLVIASGRARPPAHLEPLSTRA